MKIKQHQLHVRHMWAHSWKLQSDCRERGACVCVRGLSGRPESRPGPAVPAEGLEQLRDHGGQFVQTEQGVLGRRRTSGRLGALPAVRVKGQRFEAVHAEM